MTLQELQDLFITINNLGITAYEKDSELRAYMNRTKTQLFDPDFSHLIDPDAFVAVHLPIYLAKAQAFKDAANLT